MYYILSEDAFFQYDVINAASGTVACPTHIPGSEWFYSGGRSAAP